MNESESHEEGNDCVLLANASVNGNVGVSSQVVGSVSASASEEQRKGEESANENANASVRLGRYVNANYERVLVRQHHDHDCHSASGNAHENANARPRKVSDGVTEDETCQLT